MELIEFQEVCRLCLKQSSTNLNIFSDKNVKDKLTKVFKFTLNDHEQLSKLVCLACYEKIFRFNDYSDMVCQNQAYLSSLLQQGQAPSPFETNTIVPITENEKLDEDPIKIDFKIENNVVEPPPHEDTDLTSDRTDTEIMSSVLQQGQALLPFETNTIVPITGNEKLDEDPIQIDFKIENNVVEPPPHEETDLTLDRTVTEIIIPRKLSRTTKGDNFIKGYLALVCDLCETTSGEFESFKHLQLHYQSQHCVKGYATCCGKKFVRKDRLISHITNHINPGAFKCEICGHTSKDRNLLKIHKKQHLSTGERPFGCTQCDQKFVLRCQLVNHQATHMSEGEKPYRCEACDKTFAFKFVLAKHQKLHSNRGIKDYVCDICAKAFSHKANLKAHMTSHQSERNNSKIQCDVCSQWYKNKETLRTHIRVKHRDQREHRCDQCGKLFPSLSARTAHIRYVHLRETNYGCGQCDKRFRKNVELKEHVAREHHGKPLYQCEYCGKSFASSGNYFLHRKTKHPKEYAERQLV
ncbi:zinc finger protein OZF-like [Uranotaenia lowii]|uniref:zinc finger protein OZF-like n=1 Tax=Uranotaenia lowii TaxID=190385 RepID=UPI00247A77D0|nr:zinc finger protein OZF-like [Uranotaenia lowii]